MEVPLATPSLSLGVVQREWEQTLHLIGSMSTVVAVSEMVSPNQVAHLTIRKANEHVVAAVERILMQNLLFALWTRTEREQEVAFAGEWLFHWRRAVPWKSEK